MRWRRASNEQGRSSLRRDRLAGHYREGDQRVGRKQGDLQGPQGRDEARDQSSGRRIIRRQGRGGEHASAQRQAQGVSRPARPSIGLQEGNGDPRRGQPHRRHDGSLSGEGQIMALKTSNPVPPSLRQLIIVDRSDLYKGKPVKALTEGKNSSAGRNNNGRVTVRFHGGGHKQTYRIVDFKRRKVNVTAKIERLEYDPNRSAFIALIRYADGELAYILAPQRVSVGDEVVSGNQVDVKAGNAMPMSNMPVGTIVHNVEMKIGKGGSLARSAGTYAQIVGRDQGYVTLRLNSGEQRLVHGQCFATVGAVSNPDHMNTSIGKAGRSRWLGRRPHNRGVTMNPIDHPHGGGEGRTSGGRHPVTPWGKPTKGKKTRKNKSTTKFIVSSRHARKKG